MAAQRVLVTGGAGYLGAVLVPKLLSDGHGVTVYDCFLFGDKPLASVAGHERLTLIRGDIRDTSRMRKTLEPVGFDAVIHLAAISNDPSSDLDPELTRSVNRVALEEVMTAAKTFGVRRFLYASSASVYGIQDTPDVTEDLPLEPITLYARYKAEGEQVLWGLIGDDFVGVAVRAATVCGYSPRLRLDLTVNILTTHAVKNGRIRVFGGSQKRPNIHIEDLTDFYVALLDAPAEKVQGQAFNVCAENASVMSLAQRVQAIVEPRVPIEVEPTDDLRSYHLSGGKLRDVLGLVPRHGIDEAVRELAAAHRDGRIGDHERSIYRNVAFMKEHPEFWTRLAELP